MTRYINDEASDLAILTFAQITHPLLDGPMRVVQDVVDYTWRGELWTGVMFDFEAGADNDRPPEARIVLPAIDQRIAQALIELPERARISFWILYSDQFDLSVIPRAPIGEPVVERSFLNLELVGVNGTASSASGRLVLRDYTQQPLPGLRATKSRCPALFR
jgi:hypothetical protein